MELNRQIFEKPEIVSYTSGFAEVIGGSALDTILSKKLFKDPKFLLGLSLALGIGVYKLNEYFISEKETPKPSSQPNIPDKKVTQVDEIVLKTSNNNDVKIYFRPYKKGEKMSISMEDYYNLEENRNKKFILCCDDDTLSSKKSFSYIGVEKIIRDPKKQTGILINEELKGKLGEIYYIKNNNGKFSSVIGTYIIKSPYIGKRSDEFGFNIEENRIKQLGELKLIKRYYTDLLNDFSNEGNPKADVLYLPICPSWISGTVDNTVTNFIIQTIHNFIVAYNGNGFQINMDVKKSDFLGNMKNKIKFVDDMYNKKSCPMFNFLKIVPGKEIEEFIKSIYLIGNDVYIDTGGNYWILTNSIFRHNQIEKLMDHLLHENFVCSNINLNNINYNGNQMEENMKKLTEFSIENGIYTYFKNSPEKFIYNRPIFIVRKTYKTFFFDADDILDEDEKTAEVYFAIQNLTDKGVQFLVKKTSINKKGYETKNLPEPIFKETINENKHLIIRRIRGNANKNLFLTYIFHEDGKGTVENSIEYMKIALQKIVKYMVEKTDIVILDLSTINEFGYRDLGKNDIDVSERICDYVNNDFEELSNPQTRPFIIKLPKIYEEYEEGGGYSYQFLLVIILIAIIIILIFFIKKMNYIPFIKDGVYSV